MQHIAHTEADQVGVKLVVGSMSGAGITAWPKPSSPDRLAPVTKRGIPRGIKRRVIQFAAVVQLQDIPGGVAYGNKTAHYNGGRLGLGTAAEFMPAAASRSQLACH